MSLYAMSDLHLSHFKHKPMDIFHPKWASHTQKILKNWNEIITTNDTVIVNGDISWGINIAQARPDLDFISKLNGFKIIISGNHDYYWNSTQRLNEMYDNMFFLKNSFMSLKNYAICGTRGWICPRDELFSKGDNKIYLREAKRLINSIELALNAGYTSDKLLVATHFPPTNDKKENSLFVDIYKQYNIKRVVYGHLHGEDRYNTSLLGNVDGVNYSLVSSDYLDFKPLKIL